MRLSGGLEQEISAVQGCSLACSKPEANSQTPRRMQKVDPLKGVPMKYPLVVRVPNEGIYLFRSSRGVCGFRSLDFQPQARLPELSLVIGVLGFRGLGFRGLGV